MLAQSTAPAAPTAKPDAKTCACCADKAKCEACCKNDCKDCKDSQGAAMKDCCKGKDGKMMCARDKDGKMACCMGNKNKMAKEGCCGGMCNRNAHGKSGM